MLTNILNMRARTLLPAILCAGLTLGAPAAANAWSFGTPTSGGSSQSGSSSQSGGSSQSGSGSQASSCSTSAVSQPFAQFGDQASYSPVAGGSFEEGAPGWSLTGASVAAGNESYDVAGGSHSLAIQPNGTAVSPAFCVTTANPTLRFFARQTSGSWAVLNVLLRWTDSTGATRETVIGSLQSGTSWKPSSTLALATTLPLTQAGEQLTARIVFKPEQYGGAWAVDDVYVDPRMR